MAGKTTDRKGKGKETKSAVNELTENLAAFTLPDSLPCSEVEFPVLIKRKAGASWKQILEESDEKFKEIEAFAESKKEAIPKSPFLKTECDYIKSEVFEHLIPALEETLNKAKIWEALLRQKCFFNGIDHIVQILWNNNPRYPERKDKNVHLFNMPWVRAYLKENPRPYYPKSWLWPEDYAATLIQKTVRQYFVQREEEVQEMRDFWRKLEVERNVHDMETNPYLAKKFASIQNFRKN
ncbi:IQ domain-containing protein K-like [Ostrinia furnacalis]|uniref:IQ domain-containing protein K-like n=1 Tax=Ostrinia furnacalis TaxID=93504 RepID=UPI001040682D|nr:IQ domain-containing protein K-like [Ostrinia furnacalis]